MILSLLILVPIAAGMFLYLTRFPYYKAAAMVIQSVVLMMATWLFVTVDIIHEAPVRHILGHYDSGFGIALYGDNISAMMVIMSAFLFMLAMIYGFGKSYMSPHFIFLFLTLEGLIIGTFLAQDFFTLYAVIEVSTIIVAILIMYKKSSASIYDGVVYLFTNLVAMTFYLLGIGFIYKIFGTEDMRLLESMVHNVADVRDLILPYALMMTAVGLKAAVMPLFSWLPHAHGSHSAPYIVSAILSGLYVKGSIYIFIRLQGIFGDVLGTHELFIVLGFFTAFAAMILALSQKDIKLILAYSTVSQIGLIIVGLSLNSDYSYYGSIYHIFNHGLFKTALFMIAGILIDTYDTRDIRQISGVFKTMPTIGAAMAIALLGITGAPLFNGSISKYLIQQGFSGNAWLAYGIILVNIGTLTYTFKLFKTLFGQKTVTAKVFRGQRAVVLILSGLCFIFGLFGQQLVGVFFNLKFQWHLVDYVEKLLIYILSAAVAYLFYKQVYEKRPIFRQIQAIELTFNELIMSIFLFFAGLLGYLMVTL